ncbi:MAG: Gfo/Idh/MocA family oxidoreductase [Planctomycetota bacterium]|nr:Gfo/Idh/MocA family oxidoreductase [Planctomycetota bacterium]
MSQKLTRRTFVQASAATTAGFWVAGGLQPKESNAAIETVHFGCIGIGGKGSSDSGDAGKSGKVVGICDVDTNRLNGAKSRFKEAEAFTDYREMLEKLGDKIDAVTVSTPDHSHAPAAIRAMRKGKHAFVQKPMTHSISEARLMGELAREKKLQTEMGNQGTAGSGLREGAAIVKAGGLGKVTEVHVWTNRPVWPQGGPRPAESAAPSHLKWDLWLGPAPDRPFAKGYHPFSWRGWWDFGTGALGDMACHTFNLPFAAVDLKDPTSVEAEHSGHNKDSYPKWSKIRFEFPANDWRSAVTCFWYDGGKRPDKALLDGKNPAGSGSLIVGDKGKLYSPGDYGGSYQLLGKAEKPKVDFEKSPGHFQEWVRAIKTGKAAMSNFPDYAGPLTETILLGNLAVWSGERVEWDAKNMKPTNRPELEKIVKREYRSGWAL